VYVVEFADGPLDIDWSRCERLELAPAALRESGDSNAAYADCPAAAGEAKRYASWEKAFRNWLRHNETLKLYSTKRPALTSTAGESEGDFRIRLQDAMSERRDLEAGKLRTRYAGKAKVLEDRLHRAHQALGREQEKVSKKRLDALVSAGNAILGALLGRKKLTSATAGRIGTAIKTAGGASKESADVGRAEETVAKVQADLAALNAELENEIASLDTAYDARAEELEEITISAKSTDIAVPVFGLAWLPYVSDDTGRRTPAW
jgi:hypothetical protein